MKFSYVSRLFFLKNRFMALKNLKYVINFVKLLIPNF
jgi:hypothetical protein